MVAVLTQTQVEVRSLSLRDSRGVINPARE